MYADHSKASVLRQVAGFAGSDRAIYVCESQVSLGANSGNAKVARLTCNCHAFQRALRYPWCAHIAAVVNQETDGHSEDDFAVKHELPPVVEVPVFIVPALAVHVVLGHGPFDDSRSASVNGEHIGYIFVGQGRRSIRTLVIDWLVEKSIKLPVCPSAHHYLPLPWAHELTFNPRDKSHLTNLADLILTGRCRRCNEDDGVPDA